MLMRQERIALLLLVGVTVIVVTAHAVLTMVGKQPFAHRFSETSADGELVFIEGSVGKATAIENGGHLSLLVNNVTVFIPASEVRERVVHLNDTVHAYGIVQTYRGKKEIVIGSADDFRITTIP
jgi:hypothetical protein